MKIYELQISGEKEWIAAETTIQAIIIYSKTTGNSLEDFEEEDEIIEIPESKWNNLTIKFPDEDRKETTFSEYMEDVVTPEYIASTVY